MILEEAFCLPLWQSGHRPWPAELVTIHDLAKAAALPEETVLSRLESIFRLQQDAAIAPQALHQRQRANEPITIVDCRPETAIKGGMIPGSDSVRHGFLPDRFQKWQQNDIFVVTVGKDDARSLSAYLYFKDLGLAQGAYLAGGFEQWISAGLPVTRAE
jgi:rhodanese-related sulfurtransferase